MKTTVEIADPLLERARHHARKTGRPLRAIIEEGLRLVLRDAKSRPTYALPDRSAGIAGDPNPLEAMPWHELRDEILRQPLMLAVDTNVLVYAHRREAPEHAQAARLMTDLAEGQTPWAIPWPCIYEFFSVVTNPKIWKERATPPSDAWEQVDAWVASPSVRLLAETEDFASVLCDFLRRPRVRGAVVHDARIAALCVAHGVDALLTRDRDFSLFGELGLRDPFAQRTGR